MADASGQAEIRGIDIDTYAKGYADEENVFKKYLDQSPTNAREMRWYQKTAGFLTGVTTTGMTTDPIGGMPSLSIPTTLEQSWTRKTNYVMEFFVESPWISEADIKDSDPDVWQTTLRDLVRAVENQVDKRIFGLLSGSLALSGGCLGAGWDDTTNANPVLDILSGSALVRNQSYDASKLVMFVNPIDYKWLINYVVAKGSQFPSFASEKVQSANLMNIAGVDIVVSSNATRGFAVMIIPQRTAKWKTFTPITTAIKTEELIGRKIRVKEEGEILLTDPYAGFVIQNINA
jgi:hypothetical protein